MCKKLLIAIAAIIALAGYMLFRPASYDMARVHPALQSLAAPCQSVETTYYLDGGSLRIGIVDRVGREFVVTLPASDWWIPSGPTTYDHIYIGNYGGALKAFGSGEPGIEPLNADTKEMLADLILNTAEQNADRDHALRALRGSLKDRIRIFGEVLLDRVLGRKRSEHSARSLW